MSGGSGDGSAALAAAVLQADKPAVSRALNLVEDRREPVRAEVGALLTALAGGRPPGFGHRVGLTGPPGVGKSTLAAALGRALRARDRSVGIVAVDPSSIRSGGALLGDRARMGFDPEDDALFVRSLATGGELGGLGWAAPAAVRVLAAAYEVVLVETTGVGQTETDVVHVADTVVVVVQPGSGDTLQFLKAGIMEIPDVFVVNKADQGEVAERAVSDLRSALASLRGAGAAERDVPVVLASARDGLGMDELVAALDAHRGALGEAGLVARRSAGDLAWATELFRRRFGEHGVESLGGFAGLQKRIGAADPASSIPDRVESLGRDYLAALSK